MALITWTDEWSVNVNEIDSQHKELVGYINELNDAMLDGKDHLVMCRIMNSLSNYTIKHFGCEEEHFFQFGYPETKAHKEEHQKFVKQVTDFKKGFEEGTITATSGVMNFLRDWLFDHIQVTDKKYVSCFQANGIV